MMITNSDLDVRLAAMLADPEPQADPRFADRIVALARHDLAFRRARRRAIERVAVETAALAAVIAAFALLARSTPDPAGFGDAVALSSPAALGLVMLALWAWIANRPAASGR